MTNTFGGDPIKETEDTQDTDPKLGDTNSGEGFGSGSSSEDFEKIRKQNQHAQEHIKRLEDEAKAYRDMISDYEARTQESNTVEELLARMRENQQQASSVRNDEPTAQVVDVDKLIDTATEKALERLSQKERERVEATNFNKALEDLTRHYGEKTNEVVQRRAGELGLPIEKLDELARTSPSALVELVRGKGNVGSPGPSQGSVTGIPGGQRDELAQFAKLRKENVNLYYSPDVQKQLRQVILDKAKKEGRL